MKNFLRAILAPMSSLIIIMIGNGFFNTFVSMRVASEQGKPWLAGLVYSAFYAGMMVSSFYMEPLIKRVGHIRAFSMFASIIASVILIQNYAHAIIFWFIFRFVVGIAFAGLFIVIESWLLLLSSPKTRGIILGIYMIALYIAQGIGQFLLNIFSIEGSGAFIITAILSSFAVIPVCLMKASYPNITETEPISIKKLFKISPLGFIGSLIAGFCMSAFYSMGAIYAKQLGLSILQISQIMGFTIMGGFLLQTPIGYLSDIIERRKVIIFSSIIVALTSIAIFFNGYYPFYVLVLLFIIFGGFSFVLYPLSITYCCDFFSSDSITGITAACLIIYGIGCLMGPIISPIFMNVLGANGLMVYFTILSAALAFFGFIRSLCKAPPPKEHHEDFLSLPHTSPQAYLLDPRNEEEEG